MSDSMIEKFMLNIIFLKCFKNKMLFVLTKTSQSETI